jgi:hypothetical protein
MNEQHALEAILRRKEHSIPRIAAYWLYFKRHLLEKDSVRVYFQSLDGVLTKERFTEFLFTCPDAKPQKYGPWFCRLLPSKHARERNVRELITIVYQYYLALLASTSPIEVHIG